MPRYSFKNVRVTGKDFGQPKFWIELVDIGMWSSGKLDSFITVIQENRDRMLAVAEDLEDASEEERKPLQNEVKEGEKLVRGKLAELIVNWNLIDVDDESENPKPLPLPIHDADIFDKVPARFLGLVTDEMARMLTGNTEVPLEKKRRS